MDFSIVIPTHNRAELVARTLEAFLAQAGVSFEIIVVDDGSSDSTPQVLGGVRDARVRVIRQSSQGASAARNAGFSKATGRFVLFNDDDIIPGPGFLQAHLKLHQRYLNVAKLHQRYLNVAKLHQRYLNVAKLHQRYLNVAAVSHIYLPDSLGHQPFVQYWRTRAEDGVRGKPDAAPLGWGGFWFASLSLPRAVLPPEPFVRFKGYGWEDHELGLRLWKRGVRPRLALYARASHEDRVSLEGMLTKSHSLGRIAWQFYRLHPSLQVALWTGVHPISVAFKRWAYRWPRAEWLLQERGWEQGEQAFANYRFLLEAAYTQGLLEGKGG